jgi:uncharacterized membrane protein
MAMNYSEMEQEIRSLRDEITRLREQTVVYQELLKETRRSEERVKQSEERLFRFVAGIVTVILGLYVFFQFSISTKAIQDLYSDIENRVKTASNILTEKHTKAMETKFTHR